MTDDEVERLRVSMIEQFKKYQSLQSPGPGYETAERRAAWWDYVELREQYLRESARASGKTYRRLECVPTLN